MAARRPRQHPQPVSRKRPTGRQTRPRGPRGRWGIFLIGFLFFGFALLLIRELYQIQVVDHAVYAEKAAAQHYRTVVENPKRGHIYDRNGVELAGTTYIHQVGVTPKDVYSISQAVSSDTIAAGIAQALNVDLGQVQTALAQKDATYIQLKKDASRDEAQALKRFMAEKNIGGIRIDTEARRYYTNGLLASQLIGFCRYDDNRLIGQLGVELEYNDELTGRPGYLYVETDNYASRGVLPFSAPTSLRARDGNDLTLHLDINIQKIAQVELERAIRLYEITSGGQVVVMDPHTGGILAMASWPYFASEEPGSTMKSITTAIALEEALAHESDSVVCKPFPLFNWTISCAREGGHGQESMELAFWRSCNPVFANMALDVGINRFYTYIRSFGLTQVTGIDLPGEGVGLVHQSPTELDLATFSFGESSTVTPIQLATAYCAFANGGQLVKPTVVRAITRAEGEPVRTMRPETVRQVVSERTAMRVKDLMKGVVLYGTGTPAYSEGYPVAGKTSTSTDDEGNHTLSFAALAPADQPQVVVLVILAKPKDQDLTSKAAAQTCGRIVSQTLEYLGVERVYSESDVSALSIRKPVPKLTGLTVGEAMRLLADNGFSGVASPASLSESSLVAVQNPQAGTELNPHSLVVLYAQDAAEPEAVQVPDFRGRTIHECLRIASEHQLNILIDGSCLGLAVKQTPGPSLGPPAHAEPEPEPDPDDPDDPSQAGEDGPVQDQPLKPGDWVSVTFQAVDETAGAEEPLVEAEQED